MEIEVTYIRGITYRAKCEGHVLDDYGKLTFKVTFQGKIMLVKL